MGQQLAKIEDAAVRLQKAWDLLGDRLNGGLPVDKTLPPIPASQCKAIIALTDQLIIPAGDGPEVSRTSEILVGSFPDHGKHDRNIYLSHLTEVLSEYPASTHADAIKALVRSKKWLPSISEVIDALNEQRAQITLAKLAAERDLKRNEKMQAEKEREELIAKERAERGGEPLPGLREILANAGNMESEE